MPKCGSPLSSHEVALGYKDVSDPSIYVKFKLSDTENTYLVAWTTTPWTLISNVALAVGADIDYAEVEYKDEILIMAEARLPAVLKDKYSVRNRMKGKDLIRQPYERLFNYESVAEDAFYVVNADFVTTDDGSGIVHMAPAFGEDDYRVCMENNLPFLRPVDEAGKFAEYVADFKGLFVKDADLEIIKHLKVRSLLLKKETYIHSYPHCWRHHTPLIYYARDAWYIRTTAFKDRMVNNNAEVNWFPSEIKEGRFGNWLENNVDWSLSRDRYWGTPLPVWLNEDGDMMCVGSIEELKQGQLDNGDAVPDDIDLHRPYIDDIVFVKGDKTYRRTPEVIDAWFDSGSMPFAQQHYPFENSEIFEKQYPADFICEGIDQTRGWFYSLMAISTFLFDKSPYRNVVVNELVLDKDAKKMSKSLGNAIDPFELLDKHGADIVRWYLLVNSPVWLPKKIDEEGFSEVKKQFFRPLLESYRFFALYANIDGFSDEEEIPFQDRPELDRWVLSRLQSVITSVKEHLDSYDVTRAGKIITEFVDQELSNWYIRLSRRRFWKGEKGTDKTSAYQTLFEVLQTLTELLAPYCPFMSEKLYLNLVEGRNADAKNTLSVHLSDYPAQDAAKHDEELERRMAYPRKIVQLGRSLREAKGFKVRQPLSKIVIAAERNAEGAIKYFSDLIKQELNVKQVEVAENATDLVIRKAKPNFKTLGPKHGKKLPKLAAAIQGLDAGAVEALILNQHMIIELDGEEIPIASDDVEILHEEKEGLIVESDGNLTVALDTQITAQLKQEGFAREFVNRIQNLRKDKGFDVTDRIQIQFHAGQEAKKAIDSLSDYIRSETLANDLAYAQIRTSDFETLNINHEELYVIIDRN